MVCICFLLLSQLSILKQHPRIISQFWEWAQLGSLRRISQGCHQRSQLGPEENPLPNTVPCGCRSEVRASWLVVGPATLCSLRLPRLLCMWPPAIFKAAIKLSPSHALNLSDFFYQQPEKTFCFKGPMWLCDYYIQAHLSPGQPLSHVITLSMSLLSHHVI